MVTTNAVHHLQMEIDGEEAHENGGAANGFHEDADLDGQRGYYAGEQQREYRVICASEL